MVIFVHDLAGQQKCVEPCSASLAELRTMLALPEDVNFVYEGRLLASLDGVKEMSNLYLTAGLDGGKKKKKKKAYTTKKKNKHVHKKIKGLTLSLYSVDNGGNISYLKKICPRCGPGIFMAKHWDRYYCGQCFTTIKMDPETIRKNEEIIKKRKAELEAERKAKEKEAADKAPAPKGKAAKKGKK
jgi:small subunit ribosomal protein S27Ae